MKRRLVKLKFTAPYHLNTAGEGLEKTGTAISSDMLISALAICYSRLYGSFSPDFFSGKIRVSSLFPFYKDKLFFPAPLCDFWEQTIPRLHWKKFKKLEFLEFNLWSTVIQGKKLNAENVHLSGKFGTSPGDQSNIPDFLFEDEVQRLGQDPFYYAQVRLADDAGMFFLFEVDPTLEAGFKASLRLLGDEGIGGDRTVGKGLFYIMEEIDIDIPDTDSRQMMNLSFFIPSLDDVSNIDFQHSYYQLHEKRGWYITDRFLNLKKRGIYGFAEGSIFMTNRELTGKTVTLLNKEEIFTTGAPAFDVLRHGYIFGIRVKI